MLSTKPHPRTMRQSLLALPIALCVLAPPAHATQELFSNPPSGTNVWSSWTSCRGVDQPGFRTFDAFQINVAAPAQVTTVTWTGLYWDHVQHANNPASPNTTTWELTFYADDSNSPGQILQSVELPAATVTSTVLSNVIVNGDPVTLRAFTAQLPTPLPLGPETTYWFSPLSIQATFNPLFSWWSASTGGDCVQVSDNPASTNTVSLNRAFSLWGQAFEPLSRIRCSEVEISWPSFVNTSYRVEYCTNPATGPWSILPGANCVPGNGSISLVTDKILLGNPQRYYRVLTGGTNCVPPW